MTAPEFEQLLESTHNRLLTLTRTKGREYAGSDDQLANFRRIGDRLGMPPEAVLFVYLSKHLDAISTYIRGLAEGLPQSLSEPIGGRIEDAILYLVLLQALGQEYDSL